MPAHRAIAAHHTTTRPLVVAAAWGLFACGSAVAQQTYRIDPAHTYPSFEVSHLGYSTQRGSFERTTGTIILDRAGRRGSIDVTIDATSLATGHAKRDEQIRGEDFFNVARYPTLAWKSTALQFDGDVLTGADGELTLLGVTRPVPLKVTSFRCGVHPLNKKALCGADAVGVLRRSDFGMKAFVPAIGDDIRIAVQIEALLE